MSIKKVLQLQPYQLCCYQELAIILAKTLQENINLLIFDPN